MINHLATESSPYLRQHAGNPVHWWPWCDQARALAEREDRPILLSIGYSACHWCHVMAHESFEDPATAEVMNALFVNIKVDREERPDLDRIYQLAHQALTRRGGGWPLTVFLTPGDRLPFFAGTYFPNAPRHGMPAFVQVLRQVRQWYDHKRDQVREQNAALSGFLLDFHRGPATAGNLDDAPLRAGLSALEHSFDPVWGGFGSAPKFPHCGDLGLLLDGASACTPDDDDSRQRLRTMAHHTLARMAEGGIHDQLGGGFCRYSVDARWAIPHFEKMLYDNALLLPLYACAAADTGQDLFRDAADGIAAWLDREMRAEDGGHYAALDADSDDGHGHSEEGAFYLWTHEQVQALLSENDCALACARFGFDRPPNFEGKAWNPIQAQTTAELAERFGQPDAEIALRLAGIRQTLFEARCQRPRPGLDDKRLTAWNALLAGGYARAAGWLRRPAWAERTQAILRFLHQKVWLDGRLYASHQGGQARFLAYLDDHAFVLEALLDALALAPEPAWLVWARELANLLLDRFEDSEQGGFFFTASDHEALIARPRPFTDEALPSGNGAAIRALLRLGHLTGDTRYLDAAERALRAAWPTLTQMPQASASALSALREYLDPPVQVVIRLPEGAAASGWPEAAQNLAAQGQRAILLPPASGLLPLYPPAPTGAAYVCSGTRCLEPAHDPAALVDRLREFS